MNIHAPALAIGLSLLCNIRPPFALAVDSTPNTAPAASQSQVSTQAIAPKADALLHKVSDFYAGLKTFNTTLLRQAKISGSGTGQPMCYKIEVEKPAKLSIQISQSNKRFDGGQAKMDGDKLYLYNPVLGYVSSKATSNFDDLVRDREFQFATAYVLHGQNLLEALLSENPYQFLLQHYGINSGSIVGEETIDGIKTEHLRLKSPRIDYDIWVDRGSQPWVRRVSPERNKPTGEVKTLVFSYKKPTDSAKMVASDFAFKAPEGAKEIETFFSPAQEPEKKAKQPAKSQASQPEQHDHPLLNKPAPQLTLDTIGGGRMDLNVLKSKNVVVLDFWATWCPPCRMALPILADVTKSYEDKGVKFFAVDLKEDPSTVQKFLKDQGLTTVNVALDKDGNAAGKYGVEGIPQSVIIDKDGIVRVVHQGFSFDLKTKLTSELDEILAGKDTAH